MKKSIYSIIILASAAAVFTGCSDEQTLPVGEGKVFISTQVNSDVKVVSRATEEDELAASTIVWISNSEGVVRRYNGMDEVPTNGIKLISGEYTAKAWAGTAEYASWTSRWFEGEENFTISAGSNVAVEITCKIANVVASVKYADELLNMLEDYTLTVSHKGGSLTFEGNDDRKGYFMMPEGETTLDYVLNATVDGKTIEKHGTIENVEPAHEYVLNVIYNEEEVGAYGAGFITIEVDDTMVDVEDTITIVTPPTITGYGFDMTSPIVGSSGSVGRTCLYVCAATELTSVAVSGLYEVGNFDFIKATSDVLSELAAKGISHEVETVEAGQMIKIIFEDTYMDALPNSDEQYVFTISATDANGKSKTATLTLKISEAPVVTETVSDDDITYNSVTLMAQVAKDDVETVGFQYSINSSGWTYVAGDVTSRSGYSKGQSYAATITVPYDCTIEYRAVSGPTDNPVEFTGETMTVATKSTPQLPNSDMETWSTYDDNKGEIVPTLDYGNSTWTWDCGNHGSITMGKNVTQYSTAKKHGGTYSAELKSQFVGIASIGKLACGNIVYGHYLKTDGTDGIFGFGNAFDFDGLKPTALKLWVHYTPVAVTNTGTGCTLSKGDMDMAHLFVAVFDGPDNDDEDYPGKCGYVVHTKASASRYFDKNASNIVGYGEKILTEATSGSDMVELTIPIEYYSGKTDSSLWGIAVVCAASKEGDYYTGGDGSTLYVDDFKLVYE